MKAIKTFVKERWKALLLYFTLNFFLFLHAILSENVHSKKVAIAAIIVIMILEAALVALYAHIKERKFKIEKVFLFIYLPIALVQIFITPFNQVPDEITHIFRVDAITDGKIIAQKNNDNEYKEPISKTFWTVLTDSYSDRSYYKKLAQGLTSGTDQEEWEWKYDGAVSYNPVVYSPQILGVSLGKFLHLPIIVTMLLGRIFAALAYGIICYFALKIMPKYKTFMLLIALLPMTIQQSMAYTGDSLLFAFSFLTIAVAFKYILDEKNITSKRLFSIYTLTTVLACCKSIVYLPIAFLFMLIPAKKFKKPLIKWVIITSSILVAGLISASWSLTQEVSVQNSSGMIGYVLHNPLKYLTAIIGTLFGHNTINMVKETFGSDLSYYTYESAQIYVFIFIIIAVLLLIRNTEKLQVKVYESLMYWAIPIMIAGLLYTVSFTQWHTEMPSNYFIDGIQGRYFTAFLPLLPFMLQSNKTKESKAPLSIDYVILFIIFSNLCVVGAKIAHNI